MFPLALISQKQEANVLSKRIRSEYDSKLFDCVIVRLRNHNAKEEQICTSSHHPSFGAFSKEINVQCKQQSAAVKEPPPDRVSFHVAFLFSRTFFLRKHNTHNERQWNVIPAQKFLYLMKGAMEKMIFIAFLLWSRFVLLNRKIHEVVIWCSRMMFFIRKVWGYLKVFGVRVAYVKFHCGAESTAKTTLRKTCERSALMHITLDVADGATSAFLSSHYEGEFSACKN